jgi:tetratricopeptide (TPR) repeat protein
MTRLASIPLLLTLALQTMGADDPLYTAARHQERRDYMKAIDIALPLAGKAELAPDRRFRAYRIAGESYVAIQCPRFAIGVYQQAIVALAAHSKYVGEAWARIAAIHMSRADYGEAARVLERATAELDLKALPFEQQDELLSALARSREELHQTTSAIAVYGALVALAKTPSERAKPLARAAELYSRLYRFADAEACLGRLEGKPEGREDIDVLVDAYRRVAERAAASDDAFTRALCGRLIALFGDSGSSHMPNIVTLYLRLAKDDGAAIDTAAAIEGDSVRALASQYVWDILVPAAIRTGRASEVVLLCARAMLATPLSDDTASTCLVAIMRLRLSEGRADDALAAAKAAYSVIGYTYPSSTRFASAVELVARALRARDGHLARGNQFRRYQTYGPDGPDRKPGTPDDIPNPLAKVAFKAEPEFDKLFQAAIDALPPTADGYRLRAWAYLLWCKPDKALGELKRAFALCPLDSNSVQRAANEIAMGLRAYHSTPIGINAFATYQRYGPNGPDGKPGTSDDLKDPLAGF